MAGELSELETFTIWQLSIVSFVAEPSKWGKKMIFYHLTFVKIRIVTSNLPFLKTKALRQVPQIFWELIG